MASKRPTKLNKNKRVKAIARERIGMPAPSRPFEERPSKAKPKHKKPLMEMEEWLA